MENLNIISTFSPKSDLILSGIIKKYNLQKNFADFFLVKITMFFSRSEISEKEAISSIQKELAVSKKIAEQIMTDIKNAIIPTLWNNLSPEEKDILLHTKNVEEQEIDEEENTEFMTKLKPPIGVTAKPQITNNEIMLEKPEIIDNKFKERKENKETIEKPKKQSDSYREPIE